MLQELFYWVFNMSITAAITGVIIMLVRLMKKIPRRLTVFLWIIPFCVWYSLWDKQPLQSDVIVVQNHYKNHCRISTGGQCGFFNDE